MNTRTIYSCSEFMADDIRFLILRKNVRRLSMRPDGEGGIRVTAPLFVEQERIVAFIRDNTEWARKALAKAEQRKEQNSSLSSPPEREDVVAFLPRLQQSLDKRSVEMGLYPRKVSLRFMTSRWGSCRKDRRSITFNTALCRVPVECMDYVVVHELAHLRHADHSADFWNLVERHCPDWRTLRRRLKG